MTVKLRSPGQSSRRRVVGFVKRPLLGALFVVCIDLFVFIVILGEALRSTLVLWLLLEGGLGLLAGAGIALSSTPSISRMGETVLGTAPWSRDSERNAEKVGLKWIIGSCALIAVGFAVSAL